MKIIHCADLHLDSKLETNLDRAKAKLRRAELVRSFEKLADYAAQNGARIVIVAGDLFDHNSVTKTTVETVASVISAAEGVDFLVLSGNHDSSNAFELLSELPSNLHFFSDSWTSFDYDNVTVSGIALDSSNVNVVYTSLDLSPERFNIAVMHGDISNEINLPSLRGKHIDYLALGHLHEHSLQKLDERGVYAYSGCLESRGFDESGVKGFYFIDTDTKEYTFVSGLSERNMLEIKVDISGLMQYSEIRQKIDEEISKIGAREQDMVKVVLVGNVSLDANKAPEQLLKYLESRFFFAKIKDKTRTEIKAEDYKNDISLKGEFVRRVLSSELSDEEREQIVLLGIRAIRGEEL
ncbi:MAG: DNA repair exonuclease [Oscillospiraceae bacterium]|nr:DNA repair exonuclease [Oscillospiraceae bacterium]